MPDGSHAVRAGEAVILSPGLSQSFAIADVLQRNDPSLRVLGYPLPGERVPPRRPFARYLTVEEGEAACRDGTAIATGSDAMQHVLKEREAIRLGEIAFERRNLWFYDKVATLNRARELDIPVPRTWHSVEEANGHRGPVFLKPAREGTGGLRRRLDSLRAVPAPARDGGYLLQEVIEGASVIGFGFLADRGKIVASCLHHELFSFPPDGGSAVAVERYESPRVEELAARLIADFQYTGWGLVEFKPCARRDDFVLMELNAKFWASFEFTLRTNPLFPRLLLGVETVAEPIGRIIWPARLLRSGIARCPAGLMRSAPATRSREGLNWRDWARAVFPGH